MLACFHHITHTLCAASLLLLLVDHCMQRPCMHNSTQSYKLQLSIDRLIRQCKFPFFSRWIDDYKSTRHHKLIIVVVLVIGSIDRVSKQGEGRTSIFVKPKIPMEGRTCKFNSAAAGHLHHHQLLQCDGTPSIVGATRLLVWRLFLSACSCIALLCSGGAVFSASSSYAAESLFWDFQFFQFRRGHLVSWVGPAGRIACTHSCARTK